MTESLLHYSLHLADTSLVHGHRLSEWTGHGPMLEQDIALSNMALDLIGQARNFYQYAAQLWQSLPSPGTLTRLGGLSGPVTEDSFAYLRDAGQYQNLLIVELPIGDWAQSVLRLFLVSTYQGIFYRELKGSKDPQLAAIGEKSLKEVTYHQRWSADWVIRMGDGTPESHGRLTRALDYLWAFTGEMFLMSPYEELESSRGVAPNPSLYKGEWDQEVEKVFAKGMLHRPDPGVYMHLGGKTGTHTEHLGYLLAEMQFLQRAYPGLQW